jgi:hypothetical protein
MKYLRFKHQDTISYGLLEGDTIRVLEGSPFESYTITDTKLAMEEVLYSHPATTPKPSASPL